MRRRRTKIIATIGPASGDRQVIRDLVEAGMDAARLNFSHGDHATHRQVAAWVREAAAAVGRAVAVIQDIQGPKIRLGRFPGGAVALERDQTVRLAPGGGESPSGTLLVDYPTLLDDLAPGQPVYLADGLVRLEVVAKEREALTARVVEGGTLRDRQGAAFPDSALAVSPLTEKDRADLAFGRELGVDYVAASFVRNRQDIEDVAALAGVPVIAKIERAVAYRNLPEILQVCHGAMVARGDLGVELPLERLPLVQREILAATNRAARLSITATEMLESMTQATRPTRAEVTDVANAVLQGSDAVMLSGETATGRHPVRVVAAMNIICREVDGSPREVEPARPAFLTAEEPIPSATAQAAVAAAESLELAVIVAFTETGSTARLLSKYRPHARIVAFTPEEATYRRMAIYRGVHSRRFDRYGSTDEMLQQAEQRLLAEGICRPGDTVLMVAGIPPNQGEKANFMKLHRVGGA